MSKLMATTLVLTMMSSTVPAVPALADGVAATAIPAYSVGMPSKVVARETLWRCDGDRCQGPAPKLGLRQQVKTCADVARKIGPLTQFQAGSHIFDEAALERCNRHARKVNGDTQMARRSER